LPPNHRAFVPELCGTADGTGLPPRFYFSGSASSAVVLLRFSILPLVISYPPSPWHFLYFFPLPQGQGSFRPTFGTVPRVGTPGTPIRSGTGRGGPEGVAEGVIAPGMSRSASDTLGRGRPAGGSTRDGWGGAPGGGPAVI
jgi:hypothetical protein